MTKLSIDLETYSSVDISKCGLYKYIQSPDFEILLFAFAFDNDPVQQIDLARGEQIPKDLPGYLFSADLIKKAWNATFEWYCLSKFFAVHEPMKWLPQWQDTMVEALYCGFPGKLALIGPALGMPGDKQKMAEGKALIKYFCVPCAPTKRNGGRTRNLPQHDPAKWEVFKTYNQQDVVTEREAGRILSGYPVPPDEWRNWWLDQEINLRGVAVDQQIIDGARAIAATENDRLTQEAVQITGLDNPNSTKQLLKWLADEGEEAENLKKDTVAALIKFTDDTKIKRLLEIRQQTSKASIKKYDAMAAGACADGRIRGLTQFYGANRTGRWAGRFVQMQNLPHDRAAYETYARERVKHHDADMLRFLYPNVPATLSQLIRTAFVPRAGCKFVVADFSAIEARVIAWWAGETWRQKVFAGDGKIYEASAAQMFGVPVGTIGHDANGNDLGNYSLRRKGKVAELALGYQGSSGALINMGALEGKNALTEEELPDIVRRWRQASPRIVDLWYKCQRAAEDSIRTGRTNMVNRVAFGRTTDPAHDRDFMTITLPSGRQLFYDHPALVKGDRGDRIIYHGVHQKTHKWGQIETYGGKLVENTVQAIARDCLAITMQRLSAAGFRPVFHVHDEVISEVPIDRQDALEEACQIMAVPIPWAPGLLLRAAGFEDFFYRKD